MILQPIVLTVLAMLALAGVAWSLVDRRSRR